MYWYTILVPARCISTSTSRAHSPTQPTWCVEQFSLSVAEVPAAASVVLNASQDLLAAGCNACRSHTDSYNRFVGHLFIPQGFNFLDDDIGARFSANVVVDQDHGGKTAETETGDLFDREFTVLGGVFGIR